MVRFPKSRWMYGRGKREGRKIHLRGKRAVFLKITKNKVQVTFGTRRGEMEFMQQIFLSFTLSLSFSFNVV